MYVRTTASTRSFQPSPLDNSTRQRGSTCGGCTAQTLPGLPPAGCASSLDDDQAEEAQDAQLQAGPQEQLALLFSRPDGIVARPHVQGLQSQCSPQPHVVCSRCPPPPLPDVHRQSLPPGHGTAHPHLSSHPMPVAFTGLRSAFRVPLPHLNNQGARRVLRSSCVGC